MVDQRLPIVDSDDGVWGDILRQYLMKEHYNDDTNNSINGGHKTVTIQAGTASAGTAPLKFTSGTLLSTPEAGAIEFLTDTLYFTDSTTRRQVVTDTGTHTLTNKTIDGDNNTLQDIALTSLKSDTSTALGVGSINLGHASDTTLTRSSAGVIAVEGKDVPRKHTATIGNGSSTSIAVTHSLGTQDVTWSIRDASTDEFVDCDVTSTSTTQITFDFDSAPATNSLKVVIIG